MSGTFLKGPNIENVPSNLTLGQFFFDSAQKFGNRTCQIDTNTDEHETFFSIKQRSTRVAMEMQNRGVTPKDVIILCSATTIDTPLAIFASCYLGAKVGSLDPSLSTSQVSHLLSLVTPKMMFVEGNSIGLIEEGLKLANLKTEIVVFGRTDRHSSFFDFLKVRENEEEFRPSVVDSNEGAIIFFSSGTTGLPKAICHSNYSFLNLVHNFYYSMEKLDVTISYTSFYWITAVLFLTGTFIEGDHRIICGNQVVPEKTFQAIEKYKITCMFLAPILTYHLTNFKDYKKYDTSSLHVLITSGTPLSLTQFNKLNTIFKSTSITGCYGQTEVGVVTVFHPCIHKEFISTKSTSCGKIIAGIILKIVDIETNQILGPNQNGEICIKSNALMKGYYRADSFDVFDDEGFIKTGDIGYYDEDECLYIVERVKEMFKYMSWHIVPSAIEAVLLQHPSIREAVVFGFPRTEEEGEVPAACIVLKEDTNTSTQEIQDFVATRVSDREKLRGGVFVWKELPRTVSGKVRRKDIRSTVVNDLNKN